MDRDLPLLGGRGLSLAPPRVRSGDGRRGMPRRLSITPTRPRSPPKPPLPPRSRSWIPPESPVPLRPGPLRGAPPLQFCVLSGSGSFVHRPRGAGPLVPAPWPHILSRLVRSPFKAAPRIFVWPGPDGAGKEAAVFEGSMTATSSQSPGMTRSSSSVRSSAIFRSFSLILSSSAAVPSMSKSPSRSVSCVKSRALTMPTSREAMRPWAVGSANMTRNEKRAIGCRRVAVYGFGGNARSEVTSSRKVASFLILMSSGHYE